jgi:hypothetical protein
LQQNLPVLSAKTPNDSRIGFSSNGESNAMSVNVFAREISAVRQIACAAY